MEQFDQTINNLLTTISTKPDTAQIVVSLLGTLVLTVIMWVAYRLSNNKHSYQPRFAVTLVALSLTSTILMDLIRSNLALSLGMLGSLSIVRFRTNITDPRDIGFVFWSMAIGLSAATGCYDIGLIGSLILAVFMVLSARRGNAPRDMMLVIRGSSTDLDSIGSVVNGGCTRSMVKAKNVLSDSYEVVYQVSLHQKQSDPLIRNIFSLGGVDSVNLLADQRAA